MFKRHLPAKAYQLLDRKPLNITYIQVAEVTSWAITQDWRQQKSDALQTWLTRFPVIYGGLAVARTWGGIVGLATKRGRPRPANDSWIAACCLTYRVPLVTFNNRDFADFAKFEGLELIDIGRRKEI